MPGAYRGVRDDALVTHDEAVVRKGQLAVIGAVTAKGAPVLEGEGLVDDHAVILAVAHVELSAAERDALRKGLGLGLGFGLGKVR